MLAVELDAEWAARSTLWPLDGKVPLGRRAGQTAAPIPASHPAGGGHAGSDRNVDLGRERAPSSTYSTTSARNVEIDRRRPADAESFL